MMLALLDNIVWHTLAGPHAMYSAGTHEARRYATGFPPIVAFPDNLNPNFPALAPYVEPGEQLYCDGWAGLAPGGWRIEAECAMVKMLWAQPMPSTDEVPDPVLLGPQQAAAALELATLMRPGPFSVRTVELGEYFGIFDGTRLVAMAGGRRCAGGFAEISGVCTHPDFQGRGLARYLVAKLIRRQMLRGEKPFLRVVQDNAEAHRLYRRMGFVDYGETVARVISHWR